MGYIKHYAVIVVGWDEDKVRHFHLATQEIRTSVLARHVMPVNVGGEMLVQVGPVTPGVINSYASFYIPPDGSKRGWEHAIANNEFRREVMEAAAHEDSGVEAAEVCFGGDDAAEVFDMRTTAHPDWLKFPEPTP